VVIGGVASVLYLIGKLGRPKVAALVKGTVEIPNDISGIVYINLDEHGEWKTELIKEMRNAGYNINKNLVELSKVK
jgi:predicted nucleotide-binding protein